MGTRIVLPHLSLHGYHYLFGHGDICYFANFRDWSSEDPENCPHESSETHICSTLKEVNATCITFKCCSDFDYYDDFSEYNGESVPEEYYYIGKIFDSCRQVLFVF